MKGIAVLKLTQKRAYASKAKISFMWDMSPYLQNQTDSHKEWNIKDTKRYHELDITIHIIT